MKQAAYREGETPGQFPDGVSMEDLKNVENMISKRCNNKNLVVLPKAGGSSLMDAMGMGFNPLIGSALIGMNHINQMAQLQAQQFAGGSLPGLGIV